jgi:hypothetical protein
VKKELLATAVCFLFLGCASNQPAPAPQKQDINKTATNNSNLEIIKSYIKDKKTTENTKNIAEFDNKPVDVKEAKKILLKTNPLFAGKYKKAAIKEKVPLTPNTPLYRPPLFAEMIVFPYVSDSGIYHDTQKVWIKIKDGEFVLNQNRHKTDERIFYINTNGE